jgi:uncharacterized Rmd1/YagE family protein
MPRPRRTSRKASSSSPLDAEQRSLKAREEKLRREMEKLESMIKEAPQRAEELKRRRREELMARTAYASPRIDSRPMSLVDKRYEANVGTVPRRRRSLKSERRQERLKFLVLVVILVMVAIWLYSTFPS